MPCPYEFCVMGPEYISYLMQVMSFDPADLAVFEAGFDMSQPVTFMDMNPFILVLAPDIFARNVWAHHWQQDDPCGYVGQLIKGDVILDIEFYDGE